MKRPIYKLAMYSILFVQASNAFAAQTGVVTPIVGMSAIAASAGTYDIKNEDTTKIVEMILGQVSKVQESDLKFIEEARVSTQKAYSDLQKFITGDFSKLSNDSKLSKTIDANVFLSALSRIQELQLTLDSQIQSLNAITKGALPSQNQIQVAGNSQTVVGYRNIDMSGLVSLYQEYTKALIAMANSMPMKVALPSGGIKIIAKDTLTPNFPMVYLPEDFKKIQEQINVLRLPPEELRDLMNDHASETRRLIQAFVTNFGSSEVYRFKNEADRTARSEEIQAIQDIFWTRSYLRLSWGVRLGAIQPAAYQKRWANVEKFTVATESLRQFRQERAVSEVELANASENMRNTLEILDDRTVSILGENPDASFLARANAFMTFVGGQTQTAEALLMISQLVAADIAEEKMLVSPGGLQKLQAFYTARYQATKAMQTHYTSLKCSIDSKVEGCEENIYADAKTNQEGLRSIFNRMNFALNGMDNSLATADQIEEDLNQSIIASRGPRKSDARKKNM
jgi:hypothetical protein